MPDVRGDDVLRTSAPLWMGDLVRASAPRPLVAFVLCLPIAVMSSSWICSRRGDRLRQPPELSAEWSYGEIGDAQALSVPLRLRVQPARCRAARRRRGARPGVYVAWPQGVARSPKSCIGTGGWLYYVGAAGEKDCIDRRPRGRDPFTRRRARPLARRSSSARSAAATASVGRQVRARRSPRTRRASTPGTCPDWVGPRVGTRRGSTS